MRASFIGRFAVFSAMIGIAACTDAPDVTSPAAKPSAPTALNDILFTCNANISARTVNCGDINAGLLRADIVLGGQGTFVALHSSNITVNADTIAFDVSVENMIWQPIGTSDTSNVVDPTGIKPFFISGPTSTGAGTIRVANADGVDTFTATNQNYFQYNEVALQGETTGTRRWKLQFSPQVQNFTFQLAVSAPVKWPAGYVRDLPRVITMNPYEFYRLSGTVRSKLDHVESGSITYTSADPVFAPVSGPYVSTNGTEGFTKLTAQSGDGRPGVRDIYVDVCQSTLITNVGVINGFIEDGSCSAAFNMFAGFLPTAAWRGDLYRVDLQAGNTIGLYAQTFGGFNAVMTLADREGNVLAFNDDDPTGGPDSTGSTDAKIIYIAPTTGTYVIEVSTYSPGERGGYMLAVYY